MIIQLVLSIFYSILIFSTSKKQTKLIYQLKYVMITQLSFLLKSNSSDIVEKKKKRKVDLFSILIFLAHKYVPIRKKQMKTLTYSYFYCRDYASRRQKCMITLSITTKKKIMIRFIIQIPCAAIEPATKGWQVLNYVLCCKIYIKTNSLIKNSMYVLCVTSQRI